ncbi:MAG: hypothetical protein IAI48_08870 [Candidatus Eremiobacteraeota bacterium]|nr:hypothetical protein [Candidatus Eremiobacteraeota bacterium]
MKTLSLLIIMLTVLTCRSATATERIIFDGAWWQSLTHDEQLIAVQGMLSGYSAGFLDGAVGEELPRKPTMAQLDARTRQLDRVAKYAYAESPYSFGTIVDRISAAYRDHPALEKIRVENFYDCAATSVDGCEATAREFEQRYSGTK